ncbi:hypothetical protein CS063_11690 [Sporanaerobium hydrogeniformans]|uniref:Uncharacterized protein n=1 Tax=Sporanaerobium hydrogeniformans TaxID=3072179 RepID=A0AC61DC82_9FIRM|nr:endospore germination permease [Sporanaerobium hydrogeniformans]PHV70132.1 hypothetical protein CS063_11690 [Sporanaerobium hydrogeniformans]
MFSHNGKISVSQVKILLILQMFNTGILLLPKTAAHIVGREGYVLPIIALVFGVAYVYGIVGLTEHFKGETLVEFTPKIVPKGIAFIIIWAFAIKLIITAGLELRMFAEMISRVMLPKTPLAVILLSMLLVSAYLVKSGIEATARMAEVLIYFIFIPLIIVILFIVFKADYKQLMPFFQVQPLAIGKGAFLISLSFMPIEFMLMLTGLMEKPEKAKRATLVALVIMSVIEVIVILVTFVGIGVEESKRQLWPVITLMQSAQFLGAFVENQEILMMTCWVFSIFMYVSSGIYFVSLIGSRVCQFKRENVFVLPIIPLLFFVAMLPRNLAQVYLYYMNFQYYMGVWFLLPIPLILLIITRIKKVGGKYE